MLKATIGPGEWEEMEAQLGRIVAAMSGAVQWQCQMLAGAFSSLPAQWAIDRWLSLPWYVRLWEWVK